MTEIIPEAPASLWRKRPVTVPAIRWTGSNLAEVEAFTGGPQWFAPVAPEDREDDPERTAEVFDKLHSTWVGVHDGQWIIRGVKDELYPCDDEVLRETYEPASILGGDRDPVKPVVIVFDINEGIQGWFRELANEVYAMSGERVVITEIDAEMSDVMLAVADRPVGTDEALAIWHAEAGDPQ